MDEWKPIFVLPNVHLNAPINGPGIALAPSDDLRVTSLAAAHPVLNTFLGRFADAFQSPRQPAVLILRTDSPKEYSNVEALAAFRDLIVASIVPYGRARTLHYSNVLGAVYSDTFTLYPWMIGKDYDERMVGQTPALLALHVVGKFKGQTSPEIGTIRLQLSDIDQPLFDVLTNRWKRRFSGNRVRWEDRKLFRSLNMANQAMRVPGSSDANSYDFGRIIGLWVAAFEILAHPRTAKSNPAAVYSLLEAVHWQSKECSRRRFLAASGGRKRRTLACWLYGRIYSARNDFFHGNPLGKRVLLPSGSKFPLFHYCSPLYRLALTGFLDLNWTKPWPSPKREPAKFGKMIADKMAFTDYQEQQEWLIRSVRN